MGISESSTPTFIDHNGVSVREPYPAWSVERQIPLSKEEIEDIFLDLTQKFGFQRDSMRNMVRRLSPVSSLSRRQVRPSLDASASTPRTLHGRLFSLIVPSAPSHILLLYALVSDCSDACLRSLAIRRGAVSCAHTRPLIAGPFHHTNVLPDPFGDGYAVGLGERATMTAG